MARGDQHERGYRGNPPGDRSDNPTPAPPGVVGAFNLDQFDTAIQTLGLRFQWSRAITCYCRLDNSDQPDPTCSECKGTGWWYISPEAARERHLTRDFIPIRAVPSMAKGSFNDANEINTLGMWYGGEMQLTAHHDCMVGFRDRFKCLDQRMAFTQRLIRDTGSDMVAVGYNGRTTDEQTAAMRYEPLRINYVVGPDGTVYRRGPHWDIRERTETEPTRMYWKAGQGPANGDRYVVHYDCHPVWIVADFTYGIQTLPGPERGAKGEFAPRVLPCTFKVMLDFLTNQEGA